VSRLGIALLFALAALAAPARAQEKRLCWIMDKTHIHCGPYESVARAQAEYDAYRRSMPGPSMGVWLEGVPKPAGPRAGTGFFSFRKSWAAPALRPDKKSWAIFVGAHAAAWAVLTYDVRHTHGAREDWGSEAPAQAAMNAFDFMLFKYFSPGLSVSAPAFAVYHYGEDAGRGSR